MPHRARRKQAPLQIAGGDRPADLLEPEYDRLAKEIGALARNEEDVLSYALFPREAIEFFKDREMNEKGVNLKDIAAVAVLYMKSTERKPTANVCNGKQDQWTNVARREQMRQGGWLI